MEVRVTVEPQQGAAYKDLLVLAQTVEGAGLMDSYSFRPLSGVAPRRPEGPCPAHSTAGINRCLGHPGGARS
jgi:hypothetical protein